MKCLQRTKSFTCNQHKFNPLILIAFDKCKWIISSKAYGNLPFNQYKFSFNGTAENKITLQQVVRGKQNWNVLLQRPYFHTWPNISALY